MEGQISVTSRRTRVLLVSVLLIYCNETRISLRQLVRRRMHPMQPIDWLQQWLFTTNIYQLLNGPFSLLASFPSRARYRVSLNSCSLHAKLFQASPYDNLRIHTFASRIPSTFAAREIPVRPGTSVINYHSITSAAQHLPVT